ncbi:MAG: hypothetical protein N2662_09485 [Bacteroidales bacterium]|nr:hypothetical protein [Bacteroidales bacterium]
MVPFFYVAKGDSIPKGIFREKPDTKSEPTVIELFSTENRLKATGSSSGIGYISALMTSVRDRNDAPNTIDGLTKIPVDLNEGAGGKYIYLYYEKKAAFDPSLSITELDVITSCCYPIIVPPYSWDMCGKSFGSEGWTDLNQGAGGDFIYLVKRTKLRGTSFVDPWYNIPPIRDILIISTNKPLSSYTGWNLIPVDLNKGAGGKWIYLCYKR